MSRPNRVLETSWVVAMTWIFHRIEVVEITIKLVEAMHRRQELVQITQMVLAELAGSVTHAHERRGDGRRLVGQSNWRTGLPHGSQARADGQFAGDEVGATRCAARLGVVVSEHHSLNSKLVDIRSLARH